jgi:hypothetical protein
MNSSAHEPTRRVVVVFLLLLMVSLQPRAAIAGQQLNLSWNDNSTNELGFSVERSTGTTGTFAEIATTNAGITAYADPTVLDSTTYCYRVRAYDAVAYSDYSNTACATTSQTDSLAVVKLGLGSGTVVGTPPGIICGASCSASYPNNTAVTLTATPATGSVFSGWTGGGCSGTGACTVTLTANSSVQAQFDLVPENLTVSTSGSGTISSAPSGINCGATCTASFPYGTTVTLTATPASGFSFTGWSGACSGTGACTATLTGATAVSAAFSPLPPPPSSATLSVTRSGGKGTITSSPVGINCGSTCNASYQTGTLVTLTATPGSGAHFTGWSGACSGTTTATCTLTMANALSVTGTFVQGNGK